MSRELIFNSIDAERKSQDEQWGGSNHDDTHSVRDWVSYIIIFLSRAVNREADWGFNLKIARENFVKVAALCVAAIEAIDRKMGGSDVTNSG